MSHKNSGSGNRKRRATGHRERSLSNQSDGDNNEPTGTVTNKFNSNAVYSTHDPACDACRFKKIKCGRETPSCLNCIRGGIQCAYSDRGKRTNQTKRLIEDLGDVSSRLERLEVAVERCVSVTEGIALNSSEAGSRVSFLDYLRSDCFRNHDSSDSDGNQGGSAEDSRTVVRGNNGNEKYHGSSSTLQLFRRAQSALDIELSKRTPSNDSVQDGVTTRLGSTTPPILDGFEPSMHVDLSHDQQPISRPPRGLLDALIEPYFQQINPVFPIFSRDRFVEGINQSYSATSTTNDSAWILAFINVTLQSLSDKARSTRQDPQQPHAMDAELIKPFLANSRRAFAHTDVLLKPRLISVQALLSFCLVALDNFQIDTAELLIEQACQVARSMGLHQQTPDAEGYTWAEIQERRNVFWTLSVLEKHFSLLTGKSCCLPSYDCDVLAPEVEPGNKSQKYFLARIGLALIQERIYVNLYSAKAMRVTEGQKQIAISRLDADLRHWYERFETVLMDAKSDLTTSESVLAIEVEFIYYNCCIMVHRRSSAAPDKAQCLKEARQSLELMHTLKGIARVEKHAVLRRTCQMYPFAAFSELFSNLVREPQRPQSDLPMLQSAVEVLRDVAGADDQITYCHKLYVATSRCVATVADIIQRPSLSQNHGRPNVIRKLSSPRGRPRSSPTSPVRQMEPSMPAAPAAGVSAQALADQFQFQMPSHLAMSLGHPEKAFELHSPAMGSAGSLDPFDHMDAEDYPFGSSAEFHGSNGDPCPLLSSAEDSWLGADLSLSEVPMSEVLLESWAVHNDSWGVTSV